MPRACRVFFCMMLCFACALIPPSGLGEYAPRGIGPEELVDIALDGRDPLDIARIAWDALTARTSTGEPMSAEAARVDETGRHEGHRREAPPVADAATRRCAEVQNDGPKGQRDNTEGLPQGIPTLFTWSLKVRYPVDWQEPVLEVRFSRPGAGCGAYRVGLSIALFEPVYLLSE